MSVGEKLQIAIEKVRETSLLISQGHVLSQEEIDDVMRMMEMSSRLRNLMVQYDLKSGTPGKEVAKKFGLSTARVSQIRKLNL